MQTANALLCKCLVQSQVSEARSQRQDETRWHSYRETQVIQNIMDGLSHVRRMKVVMVRVSKFRVSIFHFSQETIQSSLVNLFSQLFNHEKGKDGRKSENEKKKEGKQVSQGNSIQRKTQERKAYDKSKQRLNQASSEGNSTKRQPKRGQRRKRSSEKINRF